MISADTLLTSVSVSVFPNWNLLGWYHEDNSTAESLGENISGCTLVLMFDAENQTFMTHVVGTPWDNFNIERGRGLFLYATVASTWYGEG